MALNSRKKCFKKLIFKSLFVCPRLDNQGSTVLCRLKKTKRDQNKLKKERIGEKGCLIADRTGREDQTRLVFFKA